MLNTQTINKKKIDEHLNEALNNLDETIDLGHNSIELLSEQSEILDNVVGNLNKINSKLEYSDTVIEDMNNIWVKPINIKKKNAEYLQLALEQKNLETNVLKRGRKTGIWNKRFFMLDYDIGIINYYSSRKNSNLKPMGTININHCKINDILYDTDDSNDMKCDKDNCFEIINKTTEKADTIHISSVSEFNKWVNLIKFITNDNDSVGKIQFGTSEQDNKIDLINEKLNEISFISVEIGNKTTTQINNINKMNNFTSDVDTHINKNINDIKKIK